MPLIAAATDASKRQHFEQQATNYLERAEEIKRSFIESVGHQQKNVKSVNGQAEASSSSNEENLVKQALKPNLNYQKLCRFFLSRVKHTYQTTRKKKKKNRKLTN